MARKVTYQDLLSELIQEAKVGTLQDDDVTAGILATASGVSEQTARTLLQNKVKQGLLVAVKVKRACDGQTVMAYRRKSPSA